MTVAADLKKKIQALEIQALRLVQSSFSGEYQTLFRGNGLEFQDLRDYQIGDDVRAMDWKVTARTGRPHLRSYTEERELVIYFLVDLSASTLLGQKRERLLELTALLALAAGKNHDRVGLVAFSDRVETYLPPRKGEAPLFKLLRTLIELRPQSSKTSLSAALQFLEKVTPHRCVVFLISDFIDEGFENPLARAARAHDLTLLHLWDPLEAGEALQGVYPVKDLESGELVWIDGGSQRRRTREAFTHEERRLALGAFCRRNGIGHLSISSKGDYFPELLKYFHLRERLSHA